MTDLRKQRTYVTKAVTNVRKKGEIKENTGFNRYTNEIKMTASFSPNIDTNRTVDVVHFMTSFVKYIINNSVLIKMLLLFLRLLTED